MTKLPWFVATLSVSISVLCCCHLDYCHPVCVSHTYTHTLACKEWRNTEILSKLLHPCEHLILNHHCVYTNDVWNQAKITEQTQMVDFFKFVFSRQLHVPPQMMGEMAITIWNSTFRIEWIGYRWATVWLASKMEPLPKLSSMSLLWHLCVWRSLRHTHAAALVFSRETQHPVLLWAHLSLTGRCCRPTIAWTSLPSNAWAPSSAQLSTLSPSSTSPWAVKHLYTHTHSHHPPENLFPQHHLLPFLWTRWVSLVTSVSQRTLPETFSWTSHPIW